MEKPKIVFIGSGNVASHLAIGLFKCNFEILQIWSKSIKNARKLAQQVKASYTSSFKRLDKKADLYILCVPDSTIQDIPNQLDFELTKQQIIAHTSGSIEMIKSKQAHNRGVFYPLQSFNKNRQVNLKEVPFLINASNDWTHEVLNFIARKLSKNVQFMDDERRKKIHLSAVILNNFIHHLVYKSELYLKENDLEFELLLPLLTTTMLKITEGNLLVNQTGPARRHDNMVIKTHLKMLKSDPQLSEIYKLISNSIKRSYP